MDFDQVDASMGLSPGYLSVLALVLIASDVQAAGLRGVEVGDSCGMAAASEIRLGSRLVSGNDSVSMLHYRGEHSGTNADIVYLCQGEQLQDQLITLIAPDPGSAYRLANQLKTAVVGKYGSPQYDGLAPGYIRKIWYSLWGVSGDVMLQSAIWQLAGREVFLWVRGATDNEWEIRLSQSSHTAMIVDGYHGID